MIRVAHHWGSSPLVDRIGVRYSRHAQQRMTMRGISEAEAQSAVQNAHTTYPDGQGNTCHVADVNGRTIKVVLSGADPEFVITAMVLS